MAELVETQCCGIRELNDIQVDSDSEKTIKDAARDWFENDMDGSFIFFSVTELYVAKGKDIAKYIKQHKLGKTHKTKSTKNPNSGNMLTMWMWEVHKTNFQKFYAKHNPTSDTEDNY